jgi:serine/threonine protein phosphatase PrpC
VSGTTATIAAVVGWELLVANVGDSCAYLDTGAEVLLVRIAASLGLGFG